ncbi:MAG TPA: ATP-binding cassette domain-containing protein [Burkholderiales bacterium]
MILEARDLWRTFGGVAAVAGVDFALEEGELRCLIGANGAGKSTFFKMLTGQLAPSRGRIVLKGEDITGRPAFEIARRGVGIKTQVPSLFDGLTVAENLWLAARRAHGARRADAVTADLLGEIRLAARADDEVGTLSHGQRQWVELGMVLAGEPDLLLLDEPAAGMTADEVEATVALIKAMRGRRTLVIVEHDMHFIRRIAEKVTVFHRGRVLVEDTMDSILRNPEVRDAYLGQRAGGLDG